MKPGTKLNVSIGRFFQQLYEKLGTLLIWIIVLILLKAVGPYVADVMSEIPM